MHRQKTVILIVDADPSTRKMLEIVLDPDDFTVKDCPAGRDAAKLAMSLKPALVLLDLDLPDMQGKEVLASLRVWSQAPVIVITARTSSEDAVSAFRTGADDYVLKPFNMSVLEARITACLRKAAGRKKNEPELVNGPLRMDLVRHRVYLAGKLVTFTPKEENIRAGFAHSLLTPIRGTLGYQNEKEEPNMFQQEALVPLLGKLGKFALRLTRNASDAQDLTQATVLRALEKRSYFQDGTNLFGWTSKIMFNLFVTRYRHKRKFDTQYDPEPHIGRITVSPAQETCVDLAIVRDKMKQLTPEHREALILVCVQGLSYSEAAEKLGVPLGTVRSRLSRARGQLQDLLEPAAPVAEMISAASKYAAAQKELEKNAS